MKADAVKIIKRLRRAGFKAYFAGGAVRDMLMGKRPKDYDIATSARPERVSRLFPGSIMVGASFGVVMVRAGGRTFQVATFRREVGASDGRHPDRVIYTDDEREDVRRRDFTINGMFYDPVSDEVIDYVGGKADLEKKIIRAIGDPERRFAEDHLRMLRAVRFAHTLGFSIDPDTRKAIQNHAADLAKISVERIENEFSRTLVESLRPGDALRELVDLGLMEHIIPEVLPMIGQEQPPEFHPEGDVFEHTALMLNLMAFQPAHPQEKAFQPASLGFKKSLAYTVLLHDVGKPDTAFMGEDRLRFHGHETKSAEMAEEILRRLKLPVKEIKQIVTAVRGHMRFKDVMKMNRSTLRKLMGADTFDLELELHRIDCEGSHGLLDNYDFLLKKAEEMASEPVLPERWIGGRDLIELGVESGPRIGELLKQAYDAQLEGRFENRETLLDWLRKQL